MEEIIPFTQEVISGGRITIPDPIRRRIHADDGEMLFFAVSRKPFNIPSIK